MSQNCELKQLFKFLSKFEFGSAIPAFSQTEIKNEPMLFSASIYFALHNGGPITKAFIQAFLTIDQI